VIHDSPGLKINGPKDARMNGGAVPIDRFMSETDPSFSANSKAHKERYGKPTHAIKIRDIKAPKGDLIILGTLLQVRYRAAEVSGGKINTWFHDTSDHGDGEKKTEKALLIWNPSTRQFHFGFPEGSDMRFTYRGIVG